MRSWIAVCSLLGVLVLGSAIVAHSKAPAAAKDAPKDAARRAASRDGWPDTRTGEMARGWVEAFSSGETAMRAFSLANLTPESLAKRSMSDRMENYRNLRERYGKLVLASVVKSAPGELTASLMDSDAARHEFVFVVQTGPPYKLVSVNIRQTMYGIHGLFHH